MPRARGLALSGFGYFAFLIASVYQMVRILPANHPFTQAENIGKFGVRDALAEAADSIVVSRKNIDQIVIFLTVLAGLILLCMQFVLFLLSVLMGKAFAAGGGGAPFKSIFVTEYPQTDIAFTLLDYVFGIPNLFGSNAIQGGAITPFQTGMQALFQFYNMAILLVAVVIFLYCVLVVVVETAQTGVPFGKRFSKLYAPFRLVFAVGLLVPLNYGFNGSQYITLYAAKLGSSMATNGWLLFNQSLSTNGGNGGTSTSNPMGAPAASLVAAPNSPKVDNLIAFFSILHTCREVYKLGVPKEYGDYSSNTGVTILPYAIVDGKAVDISDSSVTADTIGKGQVEIVIGEKDDTKNKSFPGSVRPLCGKIVVYMDNASPAALKKCDAEKEDNCYPIELLQIQYFYLLKSLWKNKLIEALGERAAHSYLTGSAHNTCWRAGELGDTSICRVTGKYLPPYPSMQPSVQAINAEVDTNVKKAIENLRNSLDLSLSDDIKKRGWGGAGIWYNHIADINGTLAAAISATPNITLYPELMEQVKAAKKAQDKATEECKIFEPNLASGQRISEATMYGQELRSAMNGMYQFWCTDRPSQDATGSSTGMTSNIFWDAIGTIFGINGLFDIRKNSEPDAATGMPKVHPLAQLSMIGKGLVDNAIRSMGIAMGASFGGGMLGAMNQHLGASAQAASGIFVSIATIGLSAGFILYYILPFLPFIYFFFAVGTWVKTIFEAMVGAPLWALAHLKIDGDGFPGSKAVGGYFLIFEIFIRPILTVFGLIAGMVIFGAMASVLNEVFDLVTTNITGAAVSKEGADLATTVKDFETFRRSLIDQFFFTIMYAVLLYMMAVASFKMIDMVPAGIMRWMGAGVPTFSDSKGDPTDNLVQYAAIGGAQVTQQIGQGLVGGAGTAGGLLGNFGMMAMKSGKAGK